MIRAANKLRVLMIADEYPPTICGIGDYSACLATALAAKGVEVNVLTKAVAGLPTEENADGVGILRLAKDWTLKDVQPILNAARRSGAGTIVHVQYPSLTNYGRRLMINLIARGVSHRQAAMPDGGDDAWFSRASAQVADARVADAVG